LEKLNEMNVWMLKLEASNKPYHIEKGMYQNMKSSLEDAFRWDFNSLIEEKEQQFYCKMPPALQTQLIRSLFGNFINKFHNFFAGCQTHFINEIVINMYCRFFTSMKDCISHKEDVKTVFFIQEGRVVIRYATGS